MPNDNTIKAKLTEIHNLVRQGREDIQRAVDMLSDLSNSNCSTDKPRTNIVRFKTPITVAALAHILGCKPFKLIAELLPMGLFANPSTALHEEHAVALCKKHGCQYEPLTDEADTEEAEEDVIPKEIQKLAESMGAAAIVKVSTNTKTGKSSCCAFEVKDTSASDSDIPEGEPKPHKLSEGSAERILKAVFGEDGEFDEYAYGVAAVTELLQKNQSRFRAFETNDIYLAVRSFLTHCYESAIGEDDAEAERVVCQYGDDIYEVLKAHYEDVTEPKASVLTHEFIHGIVETALPVLYCAKVHPDWECVTYDTEDQTIKFGHDLPVGDDVHRVSGCIRMSETGDKMVCIGIHLRHFVNIGRKDMTKDICSAIARSMKCCVTPAAKSLSVTSTIQLKDFDSKKVHDTWMHVRGAMETAIQQLKYFKCINFNCAAN